MSFSIAKRYAKALIAASKKGADGEKIAFDLAALDTPVMKQFLSNPVFEHAERLAFVEKLDIEPSTKGCLSLLIRRNRTFILHALKKAYQQELDAQEGRLRAKITTAEPISTKQLTEIVKALAEYMHQEVVAEPAVNPALLGGGRAEMGGLLFDNSIQSKLMQLEKVLCN